ncbi:Hypothetical protein CulFRC11_1778 [Corynebacterium ramonii]|uniref:Uncharacterized protein n=1 Tax=Corynebacterium ramonii TaxID=3026968 RepID=A0ABM5RTW0_9CORY|nr:Hypothetical protein CulFRC11_1778 [Corynebacterium ramonii FRC0011]
MPHCINGFVFIFGQIGHLGSLSRLWMGDIKGYRGIEIGKVEVDIFTGCTIAGTA